MVKYAPAQDEKAVLKALPHMIRMLTDMFHGCSNPSFFAVFREKGCLNPANSKALNQTMEQKGGKGSGGNVKANMAVEERVSESI
ncbi:MAG: hypothetical protein AAF570_08085 [Bacteroidota bacterium]